MISYTLIYLLLLSLSCLSGSLYINSHYVSLLHSLIFCFIQPTLKAIWTQRKKAKLRLSSLLSSWWNPSICFIMFHLLWNPHLHHIDRVLLPQHATFDLQEFGAVVKPPVPRFQWQQNKACSFLQMFLKLPWKLLNTCNTTIHIGFYLSFRKCKCKSGIELLAPSPGGTLNFW